MAFDLLLVTEHSPAFGAAVGSSVPVPWSGSHNNVMHSSPQIGDDNSSIPLLS